MRKRMMIMESKQLIDGTTRETFTNEAEYHSRLLQLQRSMGRSKLFFHGWLNGQLTIMYR